MPSIYYPISTLIFYLKNVKVVVARFYQIAHHIFVYYRIQAQYCYYSEEFFQRLWYQIEASAIRLFPQRTLSSVRSKTTCSKVCGCYLTIESVHAPLEIFSIIFMLN